MAWVVTSIVATVGNALIQRNQQKKARKRGEREAKQARVDAREAEVFAETEGMALGDLGVVDLSLDDELSEEQRLRKKGRVSSTLSV